MGESKGKPSWADRTARWKEAAQGFAEKTAEEFKDPPPPGHDAGLHGPLLQKAEVGTRTIELYEGGFIRASLFGVGRPKFERVVSITYRESTYTQDQSAVGGFITNALTAGTMSTESVKTSATITVVTEANTYSGEIKPKHGQRFEAVATRLGLGQSPGPAATSTAPDIADQIKKLADLHAAGVLTDEEFATKKAELLKRM